MWVLGTEPWTSGGAASALTTGPPLQSPLQFHQTYIYIGEMTEHNAFIKDTLRSADNHKISVSLAGREVQIKIKTPDTPAYVSG